MSRSLHTLGKPPSKVGEGTDSSESGCGGEDENLVTFREDI